MVESRYEECGLSQHTVPSNQTVLDGNGEGVPDVEASSNIWGRRRDHKQALRFDLAVFRELRGEEALCIPPVVPGGFDGDRVVTAGHGLG